MPTNQENPNKKPGEKGGKERLYDQEFTYTHKNPYHDKLEIFDEFVLRDDAPESFKGKWNQEVFQREAPLCLEIGSGYGHFMLDFTEKNPDINFLGLDYRFKRGFNLAKKLAKHPSKNFRYLRARGERIEWMFEHNELDKIFYFFPDPWPKKRHQKKRLFQNPFLEAAHKVLRPGGKLFIKTDHEDYAHWMDEIIQEQKLFSVQLRTFNLHCDHSDHFLASFQTKFEKIFLKKNIPIKAFELTALKES